MRRLNRLVIIINFNSLSKMHSLSNELLSTKVIHLKDSAVMSKKFSKLLKLKKTELQVIAKEVRAELRQPEITDVLTSPIVTKFELVQDIMSVIKNSVKQNFETICSNGRKNY